MVWREFNELRADLSRYLDETTKRVIRETVRADVRDAETAPEPLDLR